MTQTCPECGSTGEDQALVSYEPDPNDAQAETEWGSDLPTLYGNVCMDCGLLLAAYNLTDEDRQRSRTDRFRVEEELK